MGSWPNFDGWVQNAWGAGYEIQGTAPWFQGGSNMVFGQNPPYSLDDFLAVYPKFFGLPTTIANVTVVAGQTAATVPSLNGLSYGQFLVSSAFPKGTVITGLGNGFITLNNAAVASGSTVLQVYEQPPVPVSVIQLYLNLAYASLVQARWQDSWTICMAWFIAHYLTLYAKSDATEVMTILQQATHGEAPTGVVPGTAYALSAVPPGGVLQSLTKNGKFLVPGVDYALAGQNIVLTTPTVLNDALYATWPIQTQTFTAGAPSGAAIAAQGLAGGIQTSKSVGDVSVSYQVLDSLKEFGQWNLTAYGQQLASMAKVIGMGPSVVY